MPRWTVLYISNWAVCKQAIYTEAERPIHVYIFSEHGYYHSNQGNKFHVLYCLLSAIVCAVPSAPSIVLSHCLKSQTWMTAVLHKKANFDRVFIKTCWWMLWSLWGKLLAARSTNSLEAGKHFVPVQYQAYRSGQHTGCLILDHSSRMFPNTFMWVLILQLLRVLLTANKHFTMSSSSKVESIYKLCTRLHHLPLVSPLISKPWGWDGQTRKMQAWPPLTLLPKVPHRKQRQPLSPFPQHNYHFRLISGRKSTTTARYPLTLRWQQRAKGPRSKYYFGVLPAGLSDVA